MPQLHVIGAGGHAKVILALAQAAGYSIAGLYDDSPGPLAPVLGYRVTGGLSTLPDTPETLAVVAIGSNAVRQGIAARFVHIRWATLIHPSSWVAPDVMIGAGSVIMAGCVVQPGTRVGQHVIVNTAASVDHDCLVGDYAHIAPGSHLAGNVQLGEGVFAGVGTGFTPGSSVGDWTIIGAGAVVTRSLPAHVTAVGVPARVIKERGNAEQGR